jgi:hypothetical protein
MLKISQPYNYDTPVFHYGDDKSNHGTVYTQYDKKKSITFCFNKLPVWTKKTNCGWVNELVFDNILYTVQYSRVGRFWQIYSNKHLTNKLSLGMTPRKWRGALCALCN